MIREIPLIIKGYKSFKPIIMQNKKNFIYLIIFFCFEVIILASSVLSTIPLVDFIIDPNLKSPNKITLFVLAVINNFNINASLAIFLTLFVFFNIIKGFMTMVIYVIILSIKNNIEYKYVTKLSNEVLNSNWRFFQDKDVGIFINTATKVTHNISEGFSQLALQFSFLFRFLIYMTIPFVINFKLCLIAMLISFLFAYPLKFLNVFGNRWGQLNVKYDNYLFKSLSETFSAVKLILGYNLQKFSVDRISNNLKNSLNFAKKRLSVETFIIYFMQPIAILSASITFLIFYKTQNDLANMAAIFWSLVSGLPILSNLMKGNFSIVSLQPSISQYDNLMEEAQKESFNFSNHKKLKVTEFKDKIYFDNVGFSYNKNDVILNNVSFNIVKDQFILIKGKSGSGKSTFMDLIMGFQKPTEGNIFLDGKNYNDLDIKSLRGQIGYVPQDPFLFEGTILDNFKIIDNKLSKTEIDNIIEIANCREFIEKFENGIHTNVGERGKNISGGQRQRIALARALLNKPKILLLDEPTSSLDNVSTNLIYKSIVNLKNKITIILISHENIDNDIFDKTYRLENGQIDCLK